MPRLALTRIERDDVDALSLLGTLWYRAYNSNAPSAPLSIDDASAEVFACAETALWRLTGRHDDRLVSMALGVQLCEDDGAGPPIADHVLLRMVAVDTPFRNRGFGRETVNGLLRSARAQGFSEAHLWVATSNVRAQGLYEQLGFQKSGQSKCDERGNLIRHSSMNLSTHHFD